MKTRSVTTLLILAMLLLSLACGTSTPAPQRTAESVGEASEVTSPSEATTAPSEPTSAPTATSAPPPTPTPEPVEPKTLVEFEGVGETVTDDYTLPACRKAVLYWTVAANSYGSASLILKGYGPTEEETLVNEFGMNESGGISGSVLYPLAGGDYYFSSENTEAEWTVRIECQDGQAAEEGLVIEGEGNTVTGNHRLRECRKSVFVWAVQPNASGTAAIIMSLYRAGEDRKISIVNEFASDVGDVFNGEALESLDGGDYYLSIQNTTGPWSVQWECRD